VNYRREIFFRILHLYSPSSPQEEVFLSRVQAFLSIHCAKAIAAKPVSAEQQAEIIASQRYYCTTAAERQNPASVGKAFGSDWAEHYMTVLLIYLRHQDLRKVLCKQSFDRLVNSFNFGSHFFVC